MVAILIAFLVGEGESLKDLLMQNNDRVKFRSRVVALSRIRNVDGERLGRAWGNWEGLRSGLGNDCLSERCEHGCTGLEILHSIKMK